MEEEEEEGLICSSDGDATAVVVLSSLIAIASSFALGCANGYSSPAQPGIMEDLSLSVAERSYIGAMASAFAQATVGLGFETWEHPLHICMEVRSADPVVKQEPCALYSTFGSMLTIGSMLGAIVSGKVADLIGRKRAMWFLEIFLIMGWLAIVFAKGAWWLDLGRLSLGFGTGIQSYVSAVYVAEITPKSIRGGFTVAIQLMVSGGVSLMLFIGNVISWRTLALIGIIPCLVQFIGVFFIPESPRWLAKAGRKKELEASLQRLRGDNADISQEAAEIKDSMETFQLPSESRFLELFERKYARSLIVGIGIMLLVPLGGMTGILFYAGSVFEAIGFSASFGSAAMAIVQIPFSVLGILLMDKIGGRMLLMVALVGTSLGSFLAALAFLLQDLHQWKELTAPLALIGVLVHFASFAMGIAGTPWVIMAEIFPINIKGSAGSLSIFVNSLSSWIVSYVFSFFLNWSSPELEASNSLLCVIFSCGLFTNLPLWWKTINRRVFIGFQESGHI